ncbi:purine catabolism regulator [Kineococcus radiotolerans]|uniref:Purine catabolism regulator n=1 Tax=Kineococcus radiotolerans TaxID=131568 RepID=A0A7W4TI61_KINRA|nr:PucR family transcriptional regulator [Kineococcus radiotolerans]MBB2899331.1 purine catabolism regulator [Kineococcus radiotolerans]
MVLSVRSALLHPVVRDARPELLNGEEGLDAPVRWVHSSEIYEIGPLLQGGELLLTTGLGVATVDAGARRHYVRDLATRGVAALAVEVGRSLPQVPPEMADEAARRGLPLVVLHEVVPFTRISETLNTAIIGGATLRLRFAERVITAVEGAQVEERGLSGLLSAVGDLVQRPLVLVSAGGALVAAAGTSSDRDAWRVLEAGGPRASISVRGRAWGVVAAAPAALPGPGSDPGGDEDDVATALRWLVPALAMEVVRTHRAPSRPDQLAERLLSELVDGTAPADTDVLVRAGAAGFHPGVGDVVVAVAVDAPESRSGLSVLESAARVTGGVLLRGRVGAEVLGLFALAERGDQVRVVTAAVERAWQRAGRPPLRAAVGDPVRSDRAAGGWRWSLGRARAALAVAGTTRPPLPEASTPVTTSRTWALDLLLRDADVDVEDLVEATLHPLRRWDERHGSELIRTVETHLRLGCSPGRTAAALSIGRQTTYQRLRRAEELLGHPLDDADAHAGLLLATAAARLGGGPPTRSGPVPGGAVSGDRGASPAGAENRNR